MIAASLSSGDITLLLVAVVLLVVTAFLAAAEAASSRMTDARALTIAERGGFGAKRVAELVARRRQYLTTVLLVMLACQLVQAVLVGVVASRLFSFWGVVGVVAIDVVVVFVLAEAAPKTWAIDHGDAAARFTAPVVWAIAKFWPLRILVRALIGITNVIVPGKGLKDGPFLSEDELLAIASQAVSADILEEEERELIEQVIEFGDTICREVMVPRPDMLAVAASSTVAEVLELALTAGRSRVPVFGEGIDDVVGIAYVKDLVRASRSGRDGAPVRRFSRRPFFVPETKRISELMSEMRVRKSHLAVVIDEYGGTAGLVTLEDVLEELVGEIVDEYDTEDHMIEFLPGGAMRVQARMLIDDLREDHDLELPEGDWDTLGGLMFHLLGHVPFEGESVRIDGLRLRAGQVKGRRIGTVTIERDVDGGVTT